MNSTARRLMLIGALGVVLSLSVSSAQEAPAGERYEVTAVRPNLSQDTGDDSTESGTFMSLTNVTARFVIEWAYDLEPYQLAGGPGWLKSSRFDISGRAAEPPPGKRVAHRPLLKGLLADRFALKMHLEERVLDGFALTRVRANVLGPALKPTTCGGTGRPECNMGMKFGAGLITWHFKNTSMGEFARFLQRTLGRPVSDGTGVAGAFDFDLTVRMNDLPALGAGLPPSFASGPDSANDAPGLRTVLREDLGMSLADRRVPTPVWVVDSLQMPEPN